jgi:hypothetical protein
MTTSKDEEVVVEEEPKPRSAEEELVDISRMFIAVFDQMGITQMKVRPEYVHGGVGSMRCEFDPTNNGYVLSRIHE